MVSQTLPTQTLSPVAPYSPSDQASSLKNADKDGEVCGWLVNRATFETCLIIRRDKSMFVGRHGSCDLVLSEDVISNRHCRFYTSSSGLVLCEDLSTNGTYWNGRLIGKGDSMVLSHGDSIRIRCNYQFVYHDLLTPLSDHKDPEIETVEETYQILPRTLGRGSFAKVKLAIHKRTKVQLAVKIMDRIRFSCPEKSGGTNIDSEASILRSINHANIIPVVDVVKTSKYMYIFMQALLGGDLFDYILNHGPLPELEAKFMIYQTLLALQHLHNLDISHRDLKPENLLLSSATKYPRVLLSDFGMARELGDSGVMNTMCGTFAYMAPEVFGVKHAHGPGYDTTADSWSLGITLYVILSGGHPFTMNYANDDELSIYQKGAHRITDLEEYQSASEGADPRSTSSRSGFEMDRQRRAELGLDSKGSVLAQAEIPWDDFEALDSVFSVPGCCGQTGDQLSGTKSCESTAQEKLAKRFKRC